MLWLECKGIRFDFKEDQSQDHASGKAGQLGLDKEYFSCDLKIEAHIIGMQLAGILKGCFSSCKILQTILLESLRDLVRY